MKEKTETNMTRRAYGWLTVALVLSIVSIDLAVDSRWPGAFYLLAWAFCAGSIGRKMLGDSEFIDLVLPLVDRLTDRVTDRVLDRLLERSKLGTNLPGPGTGYQGRRE